MLYVDNTPRYRAVYGYYHNTVLNKEIIYRAFDGYAIDLSAELLQIL